MPGRQPFRTTTPSYQEFVHLLLVAVLRLTAELFFGVLDTGSKATQNNKLNVSQACVFRRRHCEPKPCTRMDCSSSVVHLDWHMSISWAMSFLYSIWLSLS